MAKPITRYGRRMGLDAILEADHFGGVYLADANEASESGQTAKAERLYAKGQFWLDRYNKLAGNA